MKQLLFSVITTACTIVAVPTTALDFSVHQNQSKSLTAVLATGVIEIGDTERLDHFFGLLPPNLNKAVYLASAGGNLYEGMRLGKYFRARRIKTIIEGGYVCASACALAFLGGTDSSGKPWRSSSDNSALGFHAFRGIQHMSISADDVQGIVADLLRYGKSVEAPIDLLIAGFATPSTDMFWVSQSDICALGIKLWSNNYKKFVCNN